MNRQLIVAGLVAFGLLLFGFILVTMAAPYNKPVLDLEPNGSFDEAEWIAVPGSSNGTLAYEQGSTVYTDTVDYYVIDTEVGREYNTTLIPLGTTGGMSMQVRVYYGAREFVDSDDEEIQWLAYGTTYYIRVQALTVSTPTLQTAEYQLDIDRLPIDPTDTPSNTPTNTPIPTATPFPTAVSNADAYENNNDAASAFELPVTTYLKLSDYLGVATFHTASDEDWYRLWAKDDKWYQIETSELSGVDTRLVIYKSNGTSKVTSNDDGGGGYASAVLFKAGYDGYYYIRVHNKVDDPGSYNMTIQESDEATPQPTATAGPGADSKSDSCENNLDFDHACIIASNQAKKFNFVPPYGGVDNDYFKLRIKPGYNYECATSDLDAGIDPNMIVYDQNRNGIGGNDDVEPGDLNSYFSYYASYEGWLYVLVGYGDRTPSDIYNSSYTLECKAAIPGEPTATPAPTGVPGATSTPRVTAAPPTATPAVGLKIRPLTTPTPKPETPSESVVLPISLLIYYDANGDGQPGAGEGVAGISAQAYEVSTNSLLVQGITDEQGYLEFTVNAQGPVRVTVPFFSFSQLVTDEATIRLRVQSSALP
jgi:hypothetical protein